MDTFELKLDLNLKRIALISVAEIFWKLPDVVKHVAVLKKRLLFEIDIPTVPYSGVFKCWEKIITKVLKQTNRLKLPVGVKADLEKVIVLIGEKIYFFYKHLFIFVKCDICESMVGPANYYFSNHGILKNPCLLLHWKCVPRDEDGIRITDLLLMACIFGDSKLISKYKDEAIAFIESYQSGLNLKDKKNIELNIITVWHFIHYRDNHPYLIRHVPEKYLKNTDYIIPLEKAIKENGIGDGNYGLNYYKYLNSQNLLLSILPNLDMFSNLQTELYKICQEAFPRVYRYEDRHLNDFLYGMKFLPSHEMFDFIQQHIREITVAFLPVWPYQELMAKIFDFLFKKNVDLDYEFLLEFITLNIGLQNRQAHRVKKRYYLKLFQGLWCRAPERVKVLFFVNRVKVLVSKKIKTPIVLTKKDRKKNQDDFNQLINNKCEDFVKENWVSVSDFISKIVIFDEEFNTFLKRYDVIYSH